ncbi:hypothetical protein G6F56_002632 [Rhizopus delemar]|nr:hypothetical protein G6F56_002632 [Rhizopus delemar]
MVPTLPLFGSPLVTALARSSARTSSGLCVPDILARCFSEIESNGLDLEGVFRKSGSAVVINQLQRHFETVEDSFKVKLPDNASVHSLAGLFKRYLQQLPEPVIPKQNQQQFLSAFDEERYSKEVVIKRLKEACNQMPYEHLHLLQYIVEIAVSIQQHQEKNHMSLNSLAIIFAPTCVRLDGVGQYMPGSSMAAPTQNGDSSSCSLPLTVNKHNDFFTKARKLIISVIKRKIGRSPKNNCFYNKSSMSLILYQPGDLLQLDLMKESSTWVKIFEFMMTHHEAFTSMTRYNDSVETNELSQRSIDRMVYACRPVKDITTGGFFV